MYHAGAVGTEEQGLGNSMYLACFNVLGISWAEDFLGVENVCLSSSCDEKPRLKARPRVASQRLQPLAARGLAGLHDTHTCHGQLSGSDCGQQARGDASWCLDTVICLHIACMHQQLIGRVSSLVATEPVASVFLLA